jgi:heme exporter protein CcmD
MMDWLAMGGRGQYLWPAYALTLAVIVLNVVWARRVFRQSRAEVRQRAAAEQRQ